MTTVQLSRQLVLEAQLRTNDGAGGFRRSWTALGTVWGAIRPRAGRLTTSGTAGLVSESRYQVTVRAAPVGSDRRPKAGQRFRMGARIFRILAVTEAEPDIQYLICECREEVST